MNVEFKASTTNLGDGVAVVAVVGEADLYTVPELKEALAAAVDGGTRSIVVDLSESTFIDSTTLGVLMGATRRVRPLGGGIAIVCRDPNIRKIFEITLLDRVFPIFGSSKTAIRYLRDERGANPAG